MVTRRRGYILLFICAFILCELIGATQEQSPTNSPKVLQAENNQRKRNKNNTDCHFGRSVYELQDVWHPDLGPPFGIMYCLRCECHAVQRKRKIVGKVKCKNVKNDCLEPQCDEPVLLTGRCCKTCPQDLQDTMPSEGVTGQVSSYDEGHEYASLLIADPSVPLTLTPTLASGRLVLHKRNLHYSVQYIGPERPSKVHLTDEKGMIFEDHDAHVTHLYNFTYKVCGVWSKIPRVYRKQLQDGNIYVRLTTEAFPDGIVVGQIIKISSGKQESFSTLLTPSYATNEVRRGGTAIITTSSSNNAVHFLLIFHNLAPELDGKEDWVNVRLESIQKDDMDGNVIEARQAPLEMMKHSRDNAAVQAQFTINFDDKVNAKVFRQMTRGKLLLTVAPKHSPEIRLSGVISPRISCNVYHAVLSAAPDTTDEETPFKPGAGQAVLRLAEDGSIVFRIQVVGVMSPVREVWLEKMQNKKQWRAVHHLTAEYQNGWINGTLTGLHARDIESLIQEEFYIRIKTENYRNHLRGLVKQRLFGDAHSGDFPLLLRSGNSAAAGQAWMAVDDSCRLYYEAVVSGIGYKKSNRKEVQEIGFVEFVDSSSMENLLGSNLREEVQLRQEFTGTEVDDYSDEFEKINFARLASGNALLHVSLNVTVNGNTSRTDLHATIQNLQVPSKCLPEPSNIPSDDPQNGEVDPYKCRHDGRPVDDGSQWTSSHNVCITCSCQRGKVICDTEVCPVVSCTNPRIYPGECCPSCPVNNSSVDILENETNKGCYFDGDKKFHRAGHIWHPYMHPFGFSKCATCTCNAVTLHVVCDSIVCPPLSCPEKDAIRESERACCKVCPNVKSIEPHDGSHQGEQAKNKTDQEILQEGGCLFGKQIVQNGKEWHPRVLPFGEVLCVKCRCKDGEAKCRKQKCPQLKCKNKIVSDNECCLKCVDNLSHGSRPPPLKRHRGKHGA